MLEATRSLAIGQSGHWGIIADRSTVRAVGDAVVNNLKEDPFGLTGHFHCNDDGRITSIDSGEIFAVAELEPRLDKVLQSQSSDNRIVRLAFDRFDNLATDDQCSILRITRAAREKASDVRLQTLIVGSWNLFRIQEHWRRLYHDASPAPDRNHVFFEGARTIDHVRSRLRAAELISNPPSEYENTCAEMLLEATGGDEFVVNYALNCLTAQRRRLDHLEAAIAEAIDSAEVAEEFGKRCARLTNFGRELLISTINHQFVSVNRNDSDAEDLRLEGFVETRPADGLKICMSLRSVIVDAVLRANRRAWAAGQRTVYDGKDLARPNTALNTAAYRLISKIETTLRNLIVLAFGSNSSWTERIRHVKTGAHETAIAEDEFSGLARQIQNALAPYLGDVKFATAKDAGCASQAAEDNAVKKPKQIPLIEAAENWRKRNHGNTMLDLAGNSLIYFITTEGLLNIFTNKDIYNAAVRPFFPEKAELKTFLEHYVAIRGAVAHNQPITLGTLRRLEDMRENLEKRLYRAEQNAS